MRLAAVASEICEIRRNSLKIQTSRSSKVIDLGAIRKPICDLLLVINSNFIAVSATVFEIFTVKDRKLLILLTCPFFDAP